MKDVPRLVHVDGQRDTLCITTSDWTTQPTLISNFDFPQTRSKEPKPLSTIKKRAKKPAISGIRGKLTIGLFAKREEGRRGATPKEFLRSTVALGAKLEHTKTATKKESLSMPVLAAAVNRLFKLIPAVKNGGRKLTVKNIRRRAYNEDNYVPKKNGKKQKKLKTPRVIWSYMGVPYKELDGNNATHTAVYRDHVNASGLSDLIHWLIEMVLIEIKNPITAKQIDVAAKKAAKAKKKASLDGADQLPHEEEDNIVINNDEDDFEALEETKAKVKAKVFTQYEEQAFKIEIDGISALKKKFEAQTAMDVDRGLHSPHDIAVGAPQEAITLAPTDFLGCNFEVDQGALEFNSAFLGSSWVQYIEDDSF